MEGKRRPRPVRRRRGYTLIELLIGLAVVATTLAWGVPSFGNFLRDAARTREVNQFIQAVYVARSEAIKRNGVVSLCPSRDGATCSPSSPWATGWLIFVNLDRDSPAARDGGEELLRVYEPWDVRSHYVQSQHPILPSVRADGGHRDGHVLRRPRLKGRTRGDHQPDRSPARCGQGLVGRIPDCG